MTSRNSFTTASGNASPKAAVLESMGTIQLTKSFTVVEAVSFKRSCQETLAEYPGIAEIVVDFSKTTFIDSSGIGALVIGHKLCRAHQATLRLINVPSQVMMALTLTELDKIFTIELAGANQTGANQAGAGQAGANQVGANQAGGDAVSSISPQNPSHLQPNNVPGRTTANLQSTLERLPETHPSVRSKAKRAMDILGALVGLSITAILYVVVGIIIKRDDGGPILFAQTRCSWMGKRFQIWKFRSMVVDAEARKKDVVNKVEGPLFKNDDDPRITRIGKFLRRTSLDEFPQFWNVLKGDMSLVGTRPPTPDEIEQYEVPQWQRLNVKPGMTGEWQVHGRSTVTTFEEVIQLDLRYQRRWSLLYDIQLILKTVLVLFSKNSGAM